jgi:predicted Na+-dependent transporter
VSRRAVDWGAATPEQIEASFRAWKARLILAAVQYAIVVAVAFLVGSFVVGVVTLAVGLVGLALTWRWVQAKHSALNVNRL